ncbi:rubrerythrin [Dehalogenimonas sp. WBC-2]|nr:rubrerythrin [Dehalogenimonas sp. WBC-2]
MNAEITEVLDTAMLKEVASAALYHQAAKKTDDPAAAALLKELAASEEKHLSVLKNLPKDIVLVPTLKIETVTDLKLSDYLKGPDELNGADLTDTLLFAIKREAESAAFYVNLMDIFSDRQAKDFCRILADQEQDHKRRLESLYSRIAYLEN